MAKFRPQWDLLGHKGPINCIAFTEDGAVVASGADDGHVIVWSLVEGKLSHRLRPKQGPITSIKWLPVAHANTEYRLLSGGADGTLHLWRIGFEMNVSERLSSQTVFNGSVEDIAVDTAGQIIAVTGGGRLMVFSINLHGRDYLRLTISEPPLQQAAFAALIRNTYFIDEGKCILACFLDAKEIIAWNLSPWKMIWRQKLQTRIGSTAWHQATHTLLVWNLVDGVDVYRLTDNPTGRLGFVRKLRVQVKRNYINLVQVSASGTFAMSGSDNGEIHIWDIESGRKIQELRHDKEMYPVQVISYHSSQSAKHFIASGGSKVDDEHPRLKIWTSLTDQYFPGEDTPADSRHVSPLTMTVIFISISIVAIVALLTIARAG